MYLYACMLRAGMVGDRDLEGLGSFIAMAIFSRTTLPAYENSKATNMANMYPIFSPGRLLTKDSKALID